MIFIMKWDLKPLFKSDTDPAIKLAEKSVESASYHFINKWRNRRDYLANSKVLAEALTEYEKWEKNFGTNNQACYYFMLRAEQEKNNPRVKAGFNKAKDLAIKIENDIQFFTLNLSKLPVVKQKEFLKAKELIPYHQFLTRLFETGKYTKTDAEEKILNQLADTSYHRWVDLVETMLAQEARGSQNFPTLLAKCADPKKTTRIKASRGVNDILSAWAPVAEHELNAVLEYKKNIDQIRGAEKPEELRLLSDNIERDVVEAMLSAVEKNFKLAQRYYKLKAKLLKQRKVAYYERSAPVGQVNSEWPYDKAKILVREQLAGLDSELAQIFDQFIKNNQLDVYPRNNKASGAFCADQSSTLPTYILLNYTNQWRDVRTLAHEVGHGINNELTRKGVSAIYFGTPTSTAEVASTFFEDFVLASARAKAGPKEKLTLLCDKLDDEVSSIFRQVAAYRFEQNLHKAFRQEGYLSKEKIGSLWLKEMKKYCGPAVHFEPGNENWWVHWSHFRNLFYVYSYASGLLIAKALQAKVRANPAFIKEVKKFLSAGQSASPQNLFAELGLDISSPTFWQTGLDQFAELLKEAEDLAKKVK